MAIKFPDLDRTYCRHFTACGDFALTDEKDEEALDAIAKDGQLRIAYFLSAKRVRTYVRSWVVRTKRSVFHLHIDLALSKAFTDTPLTNSKIGDVRQLISDLYGRQINVAIRSTSQIPLDKIGGFLSTLSEEMVFGNQLKARLTGGELSLKGGQDIRKLSWKQQEDAMLVLLDLEPIEAKVGATYMLDLFDTNQKVLESVILAEDQ